MKSNMNPLSAYKETKVRTASGGKLVVMLYEEAIKQLDIALDGLRKKTKKLDVVNNAIIKAQDVITELMVSLDFENGGDLAKRLFSLYIFFNGQLLEANFQKTEQPLVHVRKFLVDLKEAWAQAAKQANTNSSERGTGGINIAG